MTIRSPELSRTKKSAITYILIGCCTYKRPEKLKTLLENLQKINYPKDIKTEILIADNDIEKSGESIVENFHSKIKIHYFSEPAKGLSNARNKILKEGINLGASHIAFIDDDEIADTNWLLNHIDFYNKFENIYISSGPTYKKFVNNYPDYIINNKIFQVNESKKLGTIKKSCASGNVFFPLNIIKDNNIYFSEEFNFSGSEDINFFNRLSELGYTIGWNCNAINFENVYDDRANVKWILRRAYHNGYSVAYSRFSCNKNILKQTIYFCEKFITVLFDFVITLLSIFTGLTNFVNMQTLTVKNIGKMIGALCLKKTTYY